MLIDCNNVCYTDIAIVFVVCRNQIEQQCDRYSGIESSNYNGPHLVSTQAKGQQISNSYILAKHFFILILQYPWYISCPTQLWGQISSLVSLVDQDYCVSKIDIISSQWIPNSLVSAVCLYIVFLVKWCYISIFYFKGLLNVSVCFCTIFLFHSVLELMYKSIYMLWIILFCRKRHYDCISQDLHNEWGSTLKNNLLICICLIHHYLKDYDDGYKDGVVDMSTKFLWWAKSVWRYFW